MTTVYIIRHAEAEGNYFRRIQGQYDGGVTARGRKQIEALAERFKDVEIDALYSSDLKRTMATAGAITKYHDITLLTDPRLREINLGVWEDVPWGNVGYDQPEQLLYFSSDPLKWDIPGGESFPHLQERVYGAIMDLASRHDGQTIAVVCHGMAIRSTMCRIQGVPLENISQVAHGDNTCVAKLRVENGKAELDYFNDNSHLEEGGLSTFARQSWWKRKDSLDGSNLRLVPMDIEADGELYKQCYADAWMSAHGNLKGFDGEIYLKCIRRIAADEPQALMKVFYDGDQFAGIVELDPNRGVELGAGWISFCYMTPEMRHRELGNQLIGHAVSFFRARGRRTLRLHVAVTNKEAISFYERNEFKVIARESGVGSDLFLMETEIK